MNNKKPTKKELELCFERFLIDVTDDFFPDPIRYRDIYLEKKNIVTDIQKAINEAISQKPIKYKNNILYDWDVPKGNYTIRQACTIHPYDLIVFHYILNRLIPIIEPTLSDGRYSYRIDDYSSKDLFGFNKTKNWVKLKEDVKNHFDKNIEYQFLVSTDIAGFFEYIEYIDFKKQLLNLTSSQEEQTILLLNAILKGYNSSGIPQNCDPSSYLCTAFLDFLDKELEAQGIKFFRYVDDIKVACKNMIDAQQVIISIVRVLRKKHLNLNGAKTQIIKRNSDAYKQTVVEFPNLLSDIADALNKKNKDDINNLTPKLVEYTKKIMKHDHDERLFRACINRIARTYNFVNVNRPNIKPVVTKCLKLLVEMPGRSKDLISFLTVEKDKKYLQTALLNLITENVYYWQEMLAWNLLIQSKKIKDGQILALAKKRARDEDYHEAARNFILIFLGKHGDYQDREYIASLYQKSQSFREKRAILLALQEYPDKNSIYNLVRSGEEETILVSLVKYIKSLDTPEYVTPTRNLLSQEASY